MSVGGSGPLHTFSGATRLEFDRGLAAQVELYFHGFGSGAAEFRSHWPASEQGDPALFLDGLERDRLSGASRWFAFTARPELLARRLGAAADAVERVIEERLRALDIDARAPLGLAGHSQGAMLALELARRGSFAIERVRSYAGFLPELLRVPPAATPRRLSLDLYFSTNDAFIDPDQVERTARFFRGIPSVGVRTYRTGALTHAFSKDWLDGNHFQHVREQGTEAPPA